MIREQQEIQFFMELTIRCNYNIIIEERQMRAQVRL